MKLLSAIQAAVLFLGSLFSVQAGSLLEFRTSAGSMEVELYDQDKPQTVRNFLAYVKDVFPSRNMLLHRCMPGFILQGGGYAIQDRNSPDPLMSYAVVDRRAPVTNEFAVGPRLSNTTGTLAMAKLGGEPNSATSEWFINLGDNASNLDFQNGGFTVFGRVVKDGAVLQYFNSLRKTVSVTGCSFQGIVDLTCYFDDPGAALFEDTPVTYLTTRYPAYRDLHYIEILPLIRLTVKVGPGGSREISWNTFSQSVNVLEASEVLPPAWKPLLSGSGDGGTRTFLDPAPVPLRKFYRVRLE